MLNYLAKQTTLELIKNKIENLGQKSETYSIVENLSNINVNVDTSKFTLFKTGCLSGYAQVSVTGRGMATVSGYSYFEVVIDGVTNNPTAYSVTPCGGDCYFEFNKSFSVKRVGVNESNFGINYSITIY